MIKKVAQFGPTYYPPSYETLRNKGVEGRKSRMEERIKRIKDSWEIIGCNIVSDVLTDRQSRTLVNTLA